MRASSNEHGYTMLETIMYIGILVMLSATIAGYISKGFARYKVGRAIQQIVDIKKTVVQYTASWENYGDKYSYDISRETQEEFGALCNKKLIEDRALPLDIAKSPDGKEIRHALGGKIYIGSYANFGFSSAEDGFTECVIDLATNKYMFYVTFTGLDQAHCAEILTQGQFHGQGSELDTIVVNVQNKGTVRYFEHSFAYNENDPDRFPCVPSTKQKVMPNSTEAGAIKTTNFSVSEAMDACNSGNNNSITWIFS